MTRDQERAQLERLLHAPTTAGTKASYSAHEECFIQLYGHMDDYKEILILIHGGYFQNQHTYTNMVPMANALSQHNDDALIVLIEYRRAGGGGGYRVTAGDISSAITYIVDRFAKNRTMKTALIGHSAGGYLALRWLAGASDNEKNQISDVILLAPVSDFLYEISRPESRQFIIDYMEGMSPEKHLADYLAEDPRSLVPRFTDVTNLKILHGDKDSIVSITCSERFIGELVTIKGAGHFDLIDPSSNHFKEKVITQI